MSNRRLREKAEKLRIQQENPSLWTGLRKPGQPSKIFNRAEAEAEYQSNIEAARILAQKKAAELEGGAPATTGQAEPTGQPASRLDASPTPRLDAQPASRLDASPTPRLDAQNQSPTGAPPRRETFAEAAPTPSTPLTGGALARSNIAKMGQAGAVADYFKRAEAEKAALAQRSPLNTVGSRFTERAGTPAPESRKTFAQTFGYEMDRNEPSPALKAARENTIAAREKAGTMRAEYERSIEPPVVTPAAPAAAPTPAAPARPAPTSLFGAIREDTSGAASTVQNVGSAARLIAARGVEKTAEGAGKLIIGGARLKKGIDVAAKKKALDLIPGRTGEYLRNR